MLLWFLHLSNFDNMKLSPLSGVCWQTTQVVERAKLVTWQSQQTIRLTRLSLSRGGSRSLCLRAIWTRCWLYKQYDLNTEGMNAALSLESSINWVGSKFFTRKFYTTELCKCFRDVSSKKFPSCLTLSAQILFVFYRVLAPSFHTSSKRTFNNSWPCL